MLSMLKQMLSEDKAESVRQAVVKSLGVIVAFIDDEDKFKHCWELMLKALNDPSQLVVTSTYSVLLPALAAWAYELGSLESDFVSYFLHQLLTCIKVKNILRYYSVVTPHPPPRNTYHWNHFLVKSYKLGF